MKYSIANGKSMEQIMKQQKINKWKIKIRGSVGKLLNYFEEEILIAIWAT